MGRDKATLMLSDGRTLLARAIHTLKAAGASEILISVRQGQTYAFPDTREIVDSFDNCGPLAGLATSIEAARNEQVLIMAVDLPAMPSEYLRKLIALSTTTCGVVPFRENFFEPLVAIFPRQAAPFAFNALNAGHFSLQPWIRELSDSKLIKPVEIEPPEIGFFINWNHPHDFPTAHSP